MSPQQKDKMENYIEIYTDGASRGNPGPAAFAFIFKNEKGKIFHKGYGYIGKKTNNSAEYLAIINALKAAQKFTDREIHLFSDSQLVTRQLNQEYKVNKAHLRKYRHQIYDLVKKFKKVSFHHVGRNNSNIQKCDALCNQVLDEKNI